jgi:hypothetical protein
MGAVMCGLVESVTPEWGVRIDATHRTGLPAHGSADYFKLEVGSS